MSFNTPTFIFLFLPLAFGLFFLAPGRWKPAVALAASLIFYAWSNPVLLFPMLGFILLNYGLGRRLESRRESGKNTRLLFAASLVFNLALLVFYKAFAGYGVRLMEEWGRPQYTWILQTPLGLSYIIFQTISYLVDVQEEKCPSEKNLLTFTLYILLFPRVIAGPITAYRNLRDQLAEPRVTASDAAAGIRRFVIGLAKKLLIADQIAVLVDPVFRLAAPELSAAGAWLVILSYSLQLYFDFSGYSDMAIGLGRVMGFRFSENFNLPYIARSISDFWRRWHISLVDWFREYLFYPLEFTRRKSKWFRQPSNLLLVFALTGLWHGFTFNFLIWGVLHGLALGLETTRVGRWIKNLWPPLQHLYTLLVVSIGWVFFRSPDPQYAAAFLRILFGFVQPTTLPPLAELFPIPSIYWIALGIGLIGCLPLSATIGRTLNAWLDRAPQRTAAAIQIGYHAALLGLFAFSILMLANSTHEAYIYMQF